MKKRFKIIQILLVIVISFFILAYLGCTNFFGTKFASSVLFFENPIQENRLPDSGENALKGFGATAFFTTFLLGINLSEQSSHLHFRGLSLRHKTSVLRC